MLPTESDRMVKAKLQHLLLQGLYLHYASFWGPLRTSKQFRKQHPNWVALVALRWVQEYGLNLAIFLIGQIGLIFLYTTSFVSYLTGSVLLLAFLPALTVIQMIVDNFRSDSQVYYDPESKTGLTVKAYENSTKDTVWIFYNHFALPVGARKGKPIRYALHQQAETRNVMLACHAQNSTIAEYYLAEFVCGSSQGGKRPFLLWNYSSRSWQVREPSSFFSQLFGIHSTRNSGQIPLG